MYLLPSHPMAMILRRVGRKQGQFDLLLTHHRRRHVASQSGSATLLIDLHGVCVCVTFHHQDLVSPSVVDRDPVSSAACSFTCLRALHRAAMMVVIEGASCVSIPPPVGPCECSPWCLGHVVRWPSGSGEDQCHAIHHHHGHMFPMVNLHSPTEIPSVHSFIHPSRVSE